MRPYDEANKLIILGASVRSAAFSARRAGLAPIGADLFADADLVAWCSVTRVPASGYPQDLERVARSAPPGPWIYTGALENHPGMIGRIAASRPLWGNGPVVVRRVRDPIQVSACLQRAGLPHPEVRLSPDGLPRDGSWLIKPRAGAGGRGIRELVGEVVPKRVSNRPQQPSTQYWVLPTRQLGLAADQSATHYFQRRMDGSPCAAVFIGNGRHAALVGVTQQLVGEPALHARPFHYCGSIGPLPLEDDTLDSFRSVGNALAAEFGLVGLFGVDGVLRAETFWPVEVNPRYTASVEVLEHALGTPLVALHRDACLDGKLPELDGTSHSPPPARTTSVLGKAILFAPAELVAPDFTGRMHETVKWPGRWSVPRIADVPQPGIKIAAGSPVLTVFASHESVSECRDALIAAAAANDTELPPVADGRR